MLDKEALREEFRKNGKSQKDIAVMLNISERTMCRRMKSGVFGSDEVLIMVKELGISDPQDIFFAEVVT